MLEEAEQIGLEQGDRIMVAEAWRGLGKARLMLGDRDEAEKLLRKSVELYQAAKLRVHEGVARRSLGECLASYGYGTEQASRAEHEYRTALDIFADTNTQLEYARTARVLADLIDQAPADQVFLHEQAAELRRREQTLVEQLRTTLADDRTGPVRLPPPGPAVPDLDGDEGVRA